MSKDIKKRLNIIEPKFIDNFKNIFKDRTRLWKTGMFFSIALFFLALFGFFWHGLGFFQKEEIVPEQQNLVQESDHQPEGDTESLPCEGCSRRMLDGVYVNSEKTNLPPIAVMIDNHPEARPAHGIDKASLVYEAEVEGRFTRFMAVFDSGQEVQEIGPVRSARPYFIDWNNELNALYCHCGGSPQALAEIIEKDIFDLNEFYNAPYYWRESSRLAPHNILTSSEKLNKLLTKENVQEADFRKWKFKNDEKPVIVPYPKIEIDFFADTFDVRWEYNKDNNSYLRFLNNEKHLTAGGDEIKAKNILIQYIPAKVLDDKLRLKMDTIGWGKAIICLDGTCTNGTWQKNSSKERTIFVYEDGTEVEFNAGPIWVEVVRPDIEVNF